MDATATGIVIVAVVEGILVDSPGETRIRRVVVGSLTRDTCRSRSRCAVLEETFLGYFASSQEFVGEASAVEDLRIGVDGIRNDLRLSW